jgi:uncharacterized membrane protein YhdT
MDTLLRDLGLFGPPIREGILGIGKKKKKKKKESDDSCPEPTADQIDAVYQSQLDNYSNTINGLNSNVTDLSTQLAEEKVKYDNEVTMCAEKINNQKNDYEKKLTNQKNNYVNQLINQKNDYEKQIKQLNDKLNIALKTITTDENIIKADKEKIAILREELRLAQMNRDKCIREAIAAGKRFGFKNATVESNVYRSEIDGLFKDISQELETMQTQNLYAYTLKDHIQTVQKNLKKVKHEIEEYKDKLNLNKRKSYYEQQEIDMEQRWEIGLHIVYASIFLGIIVYLSIHVDTTTNAPKIMNPVNVGIILFLLLYPMIIYPITKSIYELIQYAISKIPKDMYMKL